MRINSFDQTNGKKALDLRELSEFEYEFLTQVLANMITARMCWDEPEAPLFLDPVDFG